MEIIIHRGSNQIGGCATEIRTKSTRILIDFGNNLPDESGEVLEDELVIEGLNSGKINFDAVLFTHYHSDHIGHIDDIPECIPVYMGGLAKEIYKLYVDRIGHVHLYDLNKIRPLEEYLPIHIGDIKITPIPSDHSAFNSYMFIIEAEGKKIIHTGDFRLHGISEYESLEKLKEYRSNLDVLIVEGTNISEKSKLSISEIELQAEINKIVKENKYVFALCSSSNIDRLASFYQAVPRGKYFICSTYQKNVLQAVARSSSSEFYQFKKALDYGENLDDKLRRRGFLCIVSQNRRYKKLMEEYPDSILIYSMWRGYLDGRNRGLSEFIKDYVESDRIRYLHSSGHVKVEDLEKFCNELNPSKGIIPIHTENPDCFEKMKLNNKIILAKDKEEYRL